MNNKKAFTLVELIATITILGVILLIAVPSYNKYVEKTRNKLIESYEKSVEDAAKAFVTDCIAKNNLQPLKDYGGSEGISLKTLQDLGFLKEDGALKEKINIDIENSRVKIKGSDESSETYSDLYQYTVVLIDKSGAEISVSNKKTNSTTTGENEQDSSEDSSGLILKNEKKEQISGTINAGANKRYTIYILNYSKFGNLKLSVKGKETQNACSASASGVVKCNIDLEDGDNEVTIKDGETEKSLIIKTDIEDPKIALSEIGTEYTNKINFTVTLSDNQKLGSYKVEPNICFESSKTDSEIKLECSITKNGTYTVSVEDSVGNNANYEIIIKNITSVEPFIVFDPNSGPLRNSGKITIEYSSGVVDGNYIGFKSNYSVAYDLLDVNNNVVSSGYFTAEEDRSGSFTIDVGDDDCNGSACTGTYKLKISEITNKAGNKITNVESGQFKIDNTPPKAANITKKGSAITDVSCGEIDSSTGNRTCQVNFNGGVAGVPVKAELNFEVEDIGYSGAEKVYYRTATTGNFQETTIDQINGMKHKDFGGKTLNLYLEVVFADAAGNIDRNKNILKINFVKNELFD